MRCYLAEKKQQAEAIAKVLDPSCKVGRHDRATHYDLAGGAVITWCEGHLYEQAPPDYYDSSLKRWTEEAEPFRPDNWILLPIPAKRRQISEVGALLSQADEVVLCSDYDREGQYLGMNAISEAGYRGRILRAKVTSLGPVELRRALSSLEDVSRTMPLFYSAQARSRSDWLVGMNLTRLFTCIARSCGCQEKINIGRVITPTVNLIVKREEEIARFVPHDFFEVRASLAAQKGVFTAKWQPRRELQDEHGQVLSREEAEKAAAACRGKSFLVDAVDRKRVSEQPPLPFSLSELQIYCGSRFHFSPAQVLGIAQKLYDNQFTSYPRTDCQHLPESQHADAPQILERLKADPAFAPAVAGADPSIVSHAFNDAKASKSAHNAIIPTTAEVDPSVLSPDEMAVYDAIRRRYAAQFYVNAEFDTVKARFSCSGEIFTAGGRTLATPGWRILYGNIPPDDEDEGAEGRDKESSQKLPPLKPGETCMTRSVECERKQTRAPQRYRTASLIRTMLHIDTLVGDEAMKARLRETKGLGTEATRASIIKNIFDYGWAVEEKGFIRATKKAIETMKAIPKPVKSPVMTALWEGRLERIASGAGSESDFEAGIWKQLSDLCSAVREPENRAYVCKCFRKLCEGQPSFPCPACLVPLSRMEGKFGPYWHCPECGKNYQDEGGAPWIPDPNGPKCPSCGKLLRLCHSKAGARFWACPDKSCGFTADDDGKGAPLMEECPKCGALLRRFRRKDGRDWFWKCRKCGSFFQDVAGKPLREAPRCPKCGRPMRWSGLCDRKGAKIASPHFYCTGYADKANPCHCRTDRFMKIIVSKPRRAK